MSEIKRRGLTPEFCRARLVRRLRDEGINNERVLDAVGKVPRHEFIEEAWDLTKAYADTALPIGRGQTISQPYIVALMTQLLLEPDEPRSVLEVGTGCGYQTAILAELVQRVYTVERIESLYASARKRLRRLNYFRVQCLHGDGRHGWARQAPFDAIIVTAAGTEIPEELVNQLAVGGRLVMPVESGFAQELIVLTKGEGGRNSVRRCAAVSFVPLLPDVAK